MPFKSYYLTELLTLKYGKNQSDVESADGKYPIYGTGGIIGRSTEYLYDKPSILIGRKGSIEKVRYVEESFWTVDTTFYSIINEELVNPYYLYCLLSLMDLSQFNEGTSIPSLRAETLYKIKVKIPNLDTQNKIASLIRTFDEDRALLAHINDNLQELMGLLFNHWLDVHDDCLQVYHLYDFSKIIYGAPFSSSLFNQNGNGYPLIRIRDLKTNSPQFFTEENHSKLTFVDPGDILIGMDAEFKPYVWIGEKGVLNQRVCMLKPLDNNICPYLPMLLIRDKLNFIETYKSGTTVSHIGKEDFDRMTINAPPISEMIKFSRIIDSFYLSYISNGIEIRRLSSFRDALLPKLMSGDVDVSSLKLPTKYSFNMEKQ